MASTPQYADIFNYLNPNTEGAKASWAQMQNSTDPTAGSYQQDSNGNTVFVPTQVWKGDTSSVPDKYKGMVQNIQNIGGNTTASYNFSRLPNQGRLADGRTIDQMIGLGAGSAPQLAHSVQGGRQPDNWYVTDKNKVSYDPNYGWVTNKMNFSHPPEPNSWMDTVGKAAWAGGMAGFGLGGSLLGAVKNYGDTGSWQNAMKGALPGLVGYGIGQFAPSLSSLYNGAKMGYGAYNTIHNMSNGGSPFAAAGSVLPNIGRFIHG